MRRIFLASILLLISGTAHAAGPAAPPAFAGPGSASTTPEQATRIDTDQKTGAILFIVDGKGTGPHRQDRSACAAKHRLRRHYRHCRLRQADGGGAEALRRLALIAALIVLAAPQAQAQTKPNPGDSCSGELTNTFTNSGGSQKSGNQDL